MAKNLIVISQADLTEYFKLRESRLLEESRIRREKKPEDVLRERIISGLKTRHKIQPGKLTAYLQEGARRPSWKEICEMELGMEFCEQIIAATDPSVELIVTANV